jgi:hypothetical protein
MAELPSHSDTGADSGESMHRRMSKRVRIAIATVIVIAAVTAVVLHLTGVIGGGSA